VVPGDGGLGQTVKESASRSAQTAQYQLADDPRMSQNLSLVEELRKVVVSGSKVVDPHGSVDDDHACGPLD
jgi:hypothetical protein